MDPLLIPLTLGGALLLWIGCIGWQVQYQEQFADDIGMVLFLRLIPPCCAALGAILLLHAATIDLLTTSVIMLLPLITTLLWLARPMPCQIVDELLHPTRSWRK